LRLVSIGELQAVINLNSDLFAFVFGKLDSFVVLHKTRLVMLYFLEHQLSLYFLIQIFFATTLWKFKKEKKRVHQQQ